MAKNNNNHDEHRPNVGLYLKVFGALMVLTVVTVAISKVHLSRPLAIGLGLTVASVKAALVCAIFMHLWGENKVIHKALWITVACGAIMLLPLIDCLLVAQRITAPVSVAEQHPGGHGEAHAAEAHATEPVKVEAAAKSKPAAKKGGH
ncbi:MAG: cytochrome C oxidase subunit IV family protein [Elusimicrobiota bacterium]|nr:MAG: cytochrome C oxidase subunit IV family protein [Elusimicrobiota bacterium]